MAKKKAVKKFSFSRAIDRVSLTILIPQVTDTGKVESVEVEHCFKIDSHFDAMEAFRRELFVVDTSGEIKMDQGAAGFALWWETISEVKNYDFTGVENWKEFFRTNPVAREHAVRAGMQLNELLGMSQVKVIIPFEKPAS